MVSRIPTIIVDTREQQPYSFPGYVVEKRALQAGDYSVKGHENEVTAERKSLDDFVATVIHSRARFARELSLMQSYRHACVVVEGPLSDVFAQRYTSNAKPAAIFGASMSITVEWGVPVFWLGDRQHAREWVEAWLTRVWRVLNPVEAKSTRRKSGGKIKKANKNEKQQQQRGCEMGKIISHEELIEIKYDQVVKVTSGGALFEIEGEEFWFPRSKLVDFDPEATGDERFVMIPSWLVSDRGLLC